MRLLVITSCTGEKAVDHDRRLTLADFRSPEQLPQRERELTPWMCPAGELYTGDQHVKLMNGVRLLRRRFGPQVVTVQIISAGYGLVPEERPLAPYEATFNTMRRREATAWAQHLNVASDVRQAIRGFPLVFFLLGAHYLKAVKPPIIPEPGQRLIFLAKPDLLADLSCPGVTVVPAGRAEASRYGSGLVALKGRLFELFALGLSRQGDALWNRVCADETAESFLGALAVGAQ